MTWYEINNAHEIASPTLLVYPDRIAENLRKMVAWAGDPSRIRPHVKTHKIPQIIQMKLDAGITKFKASTIAEVEMTAEAGGRDILMAYQPVGPHCQRLVELAKKYPDATLSTLVDNLATLEALSNVASQSGVQIPVYIDLNVGMDRTGIEINDDALELYKAIAGKAGLTQAGIHAYDGHLHVSDYDQLCQEAEAAFKPVWQFRDRLVADGQSVPNIVTSGTPTSQLLASTETVEVSAGTPVFWDSGYTKICPQYDFQHAAVLLSRVISKPNKGLLCLDLGHKAVAAESPPPRVHFFGLEEAVPVGHSEEHLVLKTERAAEYEVGSVLYGIPHHICPTVALHQEVHCVRQNTAVEAWPVVARNRRLTV